MLEKPSQGWSHLYLCDISRVQKQRATKSEDAVEHLNVQLLEREAQLAEQRTETSALRAMLDKTTKEKSQIQAENSALKM